MKVQNTGEAAWRALTIAHNAFLRKFVDTETTFPHYEVTGITTGDFSAPVTTALLIASSGTTTLAAVKTMANEARTVLVAHLGDTNAHIAADTVNAALIAVTLYADLTTTSTQDETDTFVNALVTAYEAHRILTTKHSHADTTNLITATSAIDLASSKLAVADVKAQVNAHINLSWSTPSIELV